MNDIYKKIIQTPIALNYSLIIESDAALALQKLPSASVQCIVTSPPYWGLRDYGIEGQIGLENTLQEYIVKLVAIFQKQKEFSKMMGFFGSTSATGTQAETEAIALRTKKIQLAL